LPLSRASSARRRATRSSGFQGRIAEVDLRLLRVFVCVVEHSGFAAAEIALGKSKSAISIDISSLEKRLNLSLCQRGRSGFALTTAGKSVLDATLKFFADMDAFQKRLGEATGTLSGQLRLFLPDTIQIHGETALVRAIECFSSRFPDVHMNVRSGTPREVEFAVINGTATLGITLYPQLRPEMQTTALFKETSSIYCGQRHPFFALTETDITRAELTQARMIEVSDAATSPAWDEIRSDISFSATADNVDARALLILSGVYIGFLPDLFAAPIVAEGRLRKIAFGGLFLTNSFYLLARPSPENEQLVDAFRAVLDEVSA